MFVFRFLAAPELPVPASFVLASPSNDLKWATYLDAVVSGLTLAPRYGITSQSVDAIMATLPDVSNRELVRGGGSSNSNLPTIIDVNEEAAVMLRGRNGKNAYDLPAVQPHFLADILRSHGNIQEIYKQVFGAVGGELLVGDGMINSPASRGGAMLSTPVPQTEGILALGKSRFAATFLGCSQACVCVCVCRSASANYEAALGKECCGA